MANGKATWAAIIGLGLTMAGIMYQGGLTVGQVRQQVRSNENSIEKLMQQQQTMADILIKQSRGAVERDQLEKEINRLRDRVKDLRSEINDESSGPHQGKGDDSG